MVSAWNSGEVRRRARELVAAVVGLGSVGRRGGGKRMRW